MGHAAGDLVMDPVRAFPTRLEFRLGIEFRFPDSPPPPSDSLLPARYLRIQVASPPPDRVDRSRWFEGLRVHDDEGGDREFDPHVPWKQSIVLPRVGISPFGQPPPKAIVFDEWVCVPAVPATAALTTAFTVIGPDKPDVPSNHFLSIPYPRPTIDGVELSVTGVKYHTVGVLHFTREVVAEPEFQQAWIAVSFDQFAPEERASADYVVAVEQLAEPPQSTPFAPYGIDTAL